MTRKILIQTLEAATRAVGISTSPGFFREKYGLGMNKSLESPELVREYFQEIASDCNLIVSAKETGKDEIRHVLGKGNFVPMMVFTKEGGSALITAKGRKINLDFFSEDTTESILYEETQLGDLLAFLFTGILNFSNESHPDKITVFTLMSIQPMVTEIHDEGKDHKSGFNYSSPFKRLLQLLDLEKKTIFYILIYALAAGLFSLVLPLGVQAIIGFVSSGLIFNTIFLLIIMVVAGTLVSGLLQIFQMVLVEILQQRVFTRAAFEFAFRIPKMDLAYLNKYYPPELVNRFFDVLNIQKNFSKFFTEFSAALLQIGFGIILLSFYHPFFVFFNIIIILVLFGIFKITLNKGLKTSLEESDEKYRLVNWLQEMSRTLPSFKMAGFSDLSIDKTDILTGKYLKARIDHFSILKKQFTAIVLFKAAVTGALLILGTLLVVQREITIGQFVASEIVIITILSASEKVILFLGTIFDMITSVEKIGKVTDIPLEKTGVRMIPKPETGKGYKIEIKELSYAFKNTQGNILSGITLTLKPGIKYGIVGGAGSGRSTLLEIIAGLYLDYKGILVCDSVSYREINLNSLREQIGACLDTDALFEGTLIQNITLGKNELSLSDVIEITKLLELNNTIYNLPKGYDSHIQTGGKNFSLLERKRILMARALVGNPGLVLMDESFTQTYTRNEKRNMDNIFKRLEGVTFVGVSSSPYFLKKCDNIIWMDHGKIRETGTFKELSKSDLFNDLIHEDDK